MRPPLILSAAILLSLAAALAQSAPETGVIAGTADPGVQIIVTGLGDSQKVIGVVGKPDGTYRVEHAPPGRYLVKESGPHHAAREIEVVAGRESQVDLRPPR